MAESLHEKWDTYDTAAIGVGGYTDRKLFEHYVQGAVLDVGCGRGAFLGSIRSSARRCGIDPSPRAIEQAKRDNPSCEFQVASAEKLPFPDGSFDAVYSLEVIEHVAQYQQMLGEIARVLKPGGVLFVQTPNYPAKRFYDLVYWIQGKRASLRDDYTHVSRFSFGGLRRAVCKEFAVELVRTRNILGENKVSLLVRLRTNGSLLGLLLGQKTIIVARKK